MLSAQSEKYLEDAKTSVLLIEQDCMVSTLIKSYLDKYGFNTYQDFSGEFIQQTIGSAQPNIVVLDLSNSKIDGFHLCHKIREIFDGPLMVLSDRVNESEQIMAFNLGADDYIIKPVSPNILKVRIDALLRRVKPKDNIDQSASISVGDVTICPVANKCKIHGLDIKLSTFEFQLLSLLIKNADHIMTRDAIYKLLLGREYNGVERTVDVRMSKLRDKLLSKGMSRARIETVWGKGYILNEVQESVA